MKLLEQIAAAEAAATKTALRQYGKQKPSQMIAVVIQRLHAIDTVIAAAARTNLEHAHEIGVALLALKERLPHGDYLPTLKHYEINRKTAARCTQVAAYWSLLPKHDESGKPLTITTAQQIIADLNRKAAEETIDGDGDKPRKERPPVVAERPNQASFAAYMDKLGFWSSQFPEKALPVIESMIVELQELRDHVRQQIAKQETAAALTQAAQPKATVH